MKVVVVAPPLHFEVTSSERRNRLEKIQHGRKKDPEEGENVPPKKENGRFFE